MTLKTNYQTEQPKTALADAIAAFLEADKACNAAVDRLNDLRDVLPGAEQAHKDTLHEQKAALKRLIDVIREA